MEGAGEAARGYSVVIIGAGIVGAATAYRLAAAGVTDVCVVEQKFVASGPTGRSSGVLRCLYTDPTLVAMARQGLQEYREAQNRTGADAGYVGCGWLLLVPESARPMADAGLKLEHELGLASRWLEPSDVADLLPTADLTDIVGGVFEPDGGYADPAAAATGFLNAARHLGVHYLPLTRVHGLLHSNGAVRGIRTDQGDIAADVVVNCAGAWAKELLAPLGIAAPIVTTRHQLISATQPVEPGGPVVSDPVNLVYLKPEGAGTTIGSTDPRDSAGVTMDGCPDGVEDAMVERLLERTVARFPRFADAGVSGGWSGVYDVSPDGFPVIGAPPGTTNLYSATGLSGHGFKLAPAIADILTAQATGAAPDPRANLFRWQRFAEGDAIRSNTTSALTAMTAPNS